MRALLRFAVATSSSQLPLPPATAATITTPDGAMDSYTVDLIVVLATFIGSVIFMAVLALITTYKSLRYNSSSSSAPASPVLQNYHIEIELVEIELPLLPPKRGLKKSALKALPKTRYEKPADVEQQAECVICLMEFEERERIRKLPQCGHAFHVKCVDKWLRSYPLCPFCRREVVVVPRSKERNERGDARNN